MTSTVVGRREVAVHEAYHVASLLLDGLPPILARIDLWPGEEQAGVTKLDWEHNAPVPETLRKVLIAIMLGPMSDGDQSLNDWPVDPTSWTDNRRDAEQIEFIADTLALDETTYRFLLYKAQRRTHDRRFCRLVTLVTERLLATELVLQHELTEIAREPFHIFTSDDGSPWIHWRAGRSVAEVGSDEIEGGERRLWLNGIEVDDSHTQLQRAYNYWLEFEGPRRQR